MAQIPALVPTSRMCYCFSAGAGLMAPPSRPSMISWVQPVQLLLFRRKRILSAPKYACHRRPFVKTCSLVGDDRVAVLMSELELA